MDSANHRRHPDPALLLAWAEGELPWWRAWTVRRHIRRCWTCKAAVHELESVICALPAGLPELSPVEITRAWWRFREASRHLDEAPVSTPVRLNPRWAFILAGTIALACVTTWPLLFPPTPVAPKATPGMTIQPASKPIAAPTVRSAPPLDHPETEVPTRIKEAGPIEADLLEAEIHAIAALHRSRFCLNTGITIQRVASAIEITGIVQTADERDRITAILTQVAPEGLIHVRLTDATTLTETLLTTATPATTTSETAKGAPPIAAWFQRANPLRPRLTDREIVTLMNAVVTGAEQVSSEAWAIRRLAERFPAARLRRASPGAEEQVLQIVDDHAIALADGLRRLRARLEPAAAPPPSSQASLSPVWQDNAVALQTQVEAVVRQLLSAFTAAPKDRPRPSEEELTTLMQELESRTGATLTATNNFRARPGLARR